jgi:redox-sensitive bicupin YhaK (pirin superfamily)
MRSEVRHSAQRYVTDAGDVRTLHSFSYGVHYDAANVGFGALQAINEEQVAPGAGYDAHRHADVEIVTWVLEGALAHEDTTGHAGTIRPGTAQRLSAGSGAEHAERNASATESLRFVQTMLRSRHESDPQYASLDVPDGPGLHPGVVVQADAELLVARPVPGTALEVRAAPRVLVHVTRGRLEAAGEVLGPGDELRAVEPGELLVTGDGEALVWRLLDPT